MANEDKHKYLKSVSLLITPYVLFFLISPHLIVDLVSDEIITATSIEGQSKAHSKNLAS